MTRRRVKNTGQRQVHRFGYADGIRFPGLGRTRRCKVFAIAWKLPPQLDGAGVGGIVGVPGPQR